MADFIYETVTPLMWHCAGISNALDSLFCQLGAFHCAQIMFLVDIWMLAIVQQTITCLIVWPTTKVFDFFKSTQI